MSRYSSAPLRHGGGGGGGNPSLPPKFTELAKVLEGQVHVGSLINFIGMVKDCRLPVRTQGTDFKSAMTVVDLSTERVGGEVTFDIFRPEDLMPDLNARDVIVVFQVKVQRYRQNPLSLISNRQTIIHVYMANQIPRFPSPALPALVADKKATGALHLDDEHHRYVSWFYQEADRDGIPDETEFRTRSMQSLNVKDKFSLLKDVVDGKFCNLIVQVARQPYDLHDKLTLYVSDYTENDAFFNLTWEGLSNLPGLDPYGYTDVESSPTKREWVGPYGKRAIQITCWPPHSDFIRSEVSAGKWIYLRNVQIRHGRDGQYLEGFLREDRDAATKINVDVMDSRDAENIDPRLKEAIIRCRDYSKKKKKQEKEVIAAQEAGAKRRADDSSHEDQPKAKMNSKARRKALRAALEREEEEKRLQEAAKLELNDQVACEEQSKPPSTIESMLELPIYRMPIKGVPVDVVVPFSCDKFRGRVRVVDFYPKKLAEFAVSRITSDFDVLSDAESSEDEVLSEDEQELVRRGHERVWEWRFALKLQDALPQRGKNTEPPKTLWVTVDNSEGQYLTGLDACDLEEDEDRLAELRERMFTLWGNLEELTLNSASKSKAANKSSRGRSKTPQIERPPLDSSDHELDEDNEESTVGDALSNKPFDCCIKSYGIKKRDLPTDARKMGWTRAFALFGTKIRG